MSGSPNDTIFALSSAPGRAGVSVFRVSGALSQYCLEKLLQKPSPKPRMASLRKLYNTENDLIDEALILWMPGPNSFTGEDCAEFQGHGSPAVIEAMAKAFMQLGLRQAEPGEFTRRAFENGKMDLTEAEGLADLIDAETEGQRKQALRQMQGGLRDLYENWRESLLDALAQIEGEIDFPDEEDVPDTLSHKSYPYISDVVKSMKQSLMEADKGEAIRHGVEVAIIGKPNAGKSTLLNGLAGREAAIVSSEAGTTRDIVSIYTVIAGIQVRLSDTAGLRETSNTIEAEGVKRALKLASEADIRVGVVDSTQLNDLPNLIKKLMEDDILIFSKADLPGQGVPNVSRETYKTLSIDANNDLDVRKVYDVLEQEIMERFTIGDDAGLTRARHKDCVTRGLSALERSLEKLTLAPELAGDDIRTALSAVKELAGETDIESVFDRIFSRFCVGK
ncbi:tRNA uridine-5-carboxymethylaminomethyl(34) synthesis GTPase MnmE [Hellea balneolensis]|uniref:tRNA uridine-5-carboxymethylaminomethyl(34) synthesis GTPase MnmE n=1 Tax=Hellea balneolensis TaxID=287478 RepID=UPI0004221309|nr:tRNA uridine-5-carboxymethylaminomethyl(34) synthesis GTPase MnmE [Hellea balneolensis]